MKAYIVVYNHPLKTKHGPVFIASNVLTDPEAANNLRREGQTVVPFEWIPPWHPQKSS